MIDLMGFAMAVVPFWFYYGLGVHRSFEDAKLQDYLGVPLALALGVGMSVKQSRAVWLGVFGEVGEFIRTPKWGKVGALRAGATFRPVETVAWSWCLIACALAVWTGQYGSIPFLCIFGIGYGWLGFGESLVNRRLRNSSTDANALVTSK